MSGLRNVKKQVKGIISRTHRKDPETVNTIFESWGEMSTLGNINILLSA